ncbi:MAG TPA: tripartite tricarboxylate transporter substrate binding protein [Thermodesulfobacteriota bacterium]|nr:tripartite tricarboxylate transporter substrate binding protein [Thermodesulfobacteriota bacterium]
MKKGILLLVLILGMGGLPALPEIAAAQTFPSRPIQIIVPFPPGGVSDLVARPFAAALEKAIKQPVVVVNKTGASGNVGIQGVAVAKPDGYTLLASLSTISVTPEVDRIMNRPPAFKLEDFAPIALLASDPQVLVVRKDAPWMTVGDFVADAKKRPNQIKYSHGGIYAIMHLAMELFTHAAGIKLVQIPYAGGGPAMTALLGGHVEASTPGPQVVYPQVKAGELRALAVTGSKRLPGFPDVPTMKELGYDVDYYVWTGLFAPRATPQDVVKSLRDATRQAANSAEFKTAIENMRTTVTYLDADEFQVFWEKEIKTLSQAVRLIGKIQ